MDSDGGSEYEYEYESDYGGSQQDENENEVVDEISIKIENTFYEADDCKNSNPSHALELYMQVITLQRNSEKSDNDNVKFQFRSLENIVKLCITLNKPQEMIQHYKELLTLLPHVTRNEFTDSINSILDLVSSIPNTSAVVSTTYEMTLGALKVANNDRLWFQTNVKLGRLYLDLGEYVPLKRVLKELHETCKSQDGQIDSSKATSLLEVYCLEIQLCSAINDTAKLKTIYPRTLDLHAAISDPRTMGVIREEGGKMYMSEGRWNMAYNEFFESFRNYQEAGNSRAKQCLKYVVLANMLASSDINPFDSREAKVFKDVDEINAMLLLRSAYDSNDINSFEKILKNPKNNISSDPFMKKYLDPLLRNIRCHVLVKLVGPYRSIKLANIARDMNITEKDVEDLAASLINDGRLLGKIDQIHGVLLNYPMTRDVSLKTLDSLSNWADALNKLNESMALRPLIK